MPLNPGARLGNYEILGPLGKGGMGEVYRAKDTKLGREVAVKVLSAAFANHPERLARFEREAKVLASLNHPNIATIYAVEESDEGKALIMELVPGETLKGPVSLDVALKYAAQIASALDAAHEKGITHRDLKPGNIMLTPQGVIKVLDFGLAAVTQPTGQTDDGATLPTVTLSPTQAGAILGTAAYMSPEQARGEQVDKRADIWSFGVVLHELLTGKRLFDGKKVADVLAAVLLTEPDLSSVPKTVQRLLKCCLQKDADQRLDSIRAWRMLLDDERVGVAVPTRSRLIWALGVVAVASLAVALWALWPKPEPLKPLVRLDLELDPPPTSTVGSGPVLSPDGSLMVYGARGRLWMRALDQANSVEFASGVTGTTPGPFFSQDGKSVAFSSAGTLKEVSLANGDVKAIPVEGGASFVFGGGTWSRDNSIVAASGVGGSPLIRFSATGGRAEQLGALQSGMGFERWPQWLPDGQHVLYSTGRIGVGEAGAVSILSLKDFSRTTVVGNAAMGRYVRLPDGSEYLIYVNRGTLLAAPFDSKQLKLSGTAIALLPDVITDANGGGAQMDVSANGTFLYQRGRASADSRVLEWIDPVGQKRTLLGKPGAYGRPRFSPDGSKVAMDIGIDLWTYDIQRDIQTRLTFNGGNGALWTRDGRLILFRSASGISWVRADGGITPQILIPGNNLLYPWSFSPDGKRLAYFEITSAGYDVYTVSVESDSTTIKVGTPEPFLKTSADERYPSFSPDGKWMLYTSNESGSFEAYVRAFPDKGGKWQISNAGASYPVWSSDGRTILYRTSEDRVMAVDYTAKGDSFTAGKPRQWSPQKLLEVGTALGYDIHPDGKRIVSVMLDESAGDTRNATHVTILFNFFDEIRRRAQAGAK